MTIRFLALLVGLWSGIAAAQLPDPASFERENRQEERHLEQQQEQYKSRLRELSPAEERELEARLRRQREAQRLLQERQRQRLLQERLSRQQALERGEPPGPPITPQFRWEQQRQQFRFELERKAWPYPEK